MFKYKKEKKKKKEFQQEIDLAIGLKMERFAQANYQHFTSFDELKKISESKINPYYKKTNYQQQAGFSAEVKQRARYNADKILEGKKDRIERTDNVGAVNHNKYDHVKVDDKGNLIIDVNGNYVGGSQQKNFSKIKNYDKLHKKEYKHYKDTPIDVPSDQYDQIMEKCDQEKETLVDQENHLKDQGRIEEANNIKKKIEKIDDTAGRLRKSKVSSKEAMEARKNYKISVAKDIGKISHKAGVNAAKSGAIFGGVISTVGNTKALFDGEIDFEKAFLNVSGDVVKVSSKAYTNSASASVVGGALKASNKQFLKNLSKKNGPTAIVATAGILAKQTKNLVSGKITPEEFAKNIKKEGFSLASSMMGSNLGAIVGTAIFPGVGTVVGGFVGGMITSMLSSATYSELIKTVNDTKISEEKRKIISEYCKKLKEDEIRYRNETINLFNQFFDEKETQIRKGFDMISESIMNGKNINTGLSEVAKAFNLDLAFSTTDELTNYIKSGKTLEL